MGRAFDQAEYLPLRGNRIINGCFEEDQRNLGVGILTADNVYWADRWRLVCERASEAVFSRRTPPDTGHFYRNGLLQFQGTTNKGGFYQVIEGINCHDLTNSTVVLSARLNGNATMKLRMGIIAFTGTEDAVSGDPISTWNADGTNPTLAANYSFVNTPTTLTLLAAASVFSVTGTIPSNATNVAVLIWNDSKTYNALDTFQASEVQLERGSAASPYQFVNYTLQRQQCFRYYQRRADAFTAGWSPTYTKNGGAVNFPEMRAVPSVTITAGGLAGHHSTAPTVNAHYGVFASSIGFEFTGAASRTGENVVGNATYLLNAEL